MPLTMRPTGLGAGIDIAAAALRGCYYRRHGQAAFMASKANLLKFSCILAGRASMYCTTTRAN